MQFGTWSYLLQGKGGNALDPDTVAGIDADLVVVDYSRNGREEGAFTASEVDAMASAVR